MMSTSNDKENPGTGPSDKYDASCEYSPNASKKALKPISPNKGPNSYVGKLNFLQGDNIDNHFTNIHSSHQQLHQVLHNLEVQTTQTGIDLGQLCDRLKNNNQYLNKLLENITNYSNEVITEGNATKNDITNIISRLDLFNEELKKIRTSDDSKNLTDNIREIVRVEMGNNTPSSQQDILHKVKEAVSDCLEGIPVNNDFKALAKSINESHTTNDQRHEKLLNEVLLIQQRVPESDLVRQIVDPIVAELKSVSLDSNSLKLLGDILDILNREKETNKATELFQTTSTEKLENITKELSTHNESKQAINDLVRRLDDLHQETQTQNNDILLQLSTGAVQSNELSNLQTSMIDVKKALESKDAQISKLTKLVENQSTLINDLASKSEKLYTKQNLEKSITNLEHKYDLLCKNYEQKFNDLKLVQSEFKELAENIQNINTDTAKSTDMNKPDKILKLQKIRQLHNSKMSEIQEHNQSNNLKTNKRIMSTPITHKLRGSNQIFDQINEYNESPNNSEEEF